MLETGKRADWNKKRKFLRSVTTFWISEELKTLLPHVSRAQNETRLNA